MHFVFVLLCAASRWFRPALKGRSSLEKEPCALQCSFFWWVCGSMTDVRTTPHDGAASCQPSVEGTSVKFIPPTISRDWSCSWQGSQVFVLVVNIFYPFIVCAIPSIHSQQQLTQCTETWCLDLLNLVLLGSSSLRPGLYLASFPLLDTTG